MKKPQIFVVFILILLYITACNSPEASPTATATADLRTPMALTAEANAAAETAAAEAAAQDSATAEAIAQSETQTAVAELEALKATSTAQMQATETFLAEIADATATAQAEADATQMAIAESTQSAQPMADLVTSLHEEGAIQTTDGTYHSLWDFDKDWAQLNWFMWYPTFYSPKNFVLEADIAYESASDTADWWVSGCGFVFRYQEGGNIDFYVAFVTLDGYGEISRYRNGSGTILSRGFYGKLDLPKGNLKMTLTAEDSILNLYINGERVVRVSDGTFPDGSIYYTLSSGTNKDFGTSCEMTNVGLWTLEE